MKTEGDKLPGKRPAATRDVEIGSAGFAWLGGLTVFAFAWIGRFIATGEAVAPSPYYSPKPRRPCAPARY